MNWEDIYKIYPVVPRLVELSKEARPVAFLHRQTWSYGEFVPAAGGFWYFWCTEVGPTSPHDVRGGNKPSILPMAWVSLCLSAPTISWSEAKFMLRETTMFGRWERGKPWTYNAAFFTSREDYMSRVVLVGATRVGQRSPHRTDSMSEAPASAPPSE